MGFKVAFEQLGSYRYKIETRNWEKIPFSSRIVPMGLTVADEPKTGFHNAAHLYSDQANPLVDPERAPLKEVLGGQYTYREGEGKCCGRALIKVAR